MKIYGALIILVASVLLTGCAELQHASSKPSAPAINSATSSNTKPAWFYSPCQDGKIGGVGISGMHINGISAQRELAVSRAIDEIARQLGVKVSNILKTSTVANNSSASTMMESYSFQTVDGRNISASIAGIWNDTTTDELYIWMLTSQKQ